MIYERIEPSAPLTRFIESFWIIDSQGNRDESIQKIIPDGYPEIIFHYSNAYEIKLRDSWERQSSRLLAGQIKKHFFLKNTGVSGMVGIKLMPAAPSLLFDVDMSQTTNEVLDMTTLENTFLSPLLKLSPTLEDKDDFIKDAESILLSLSDKLETEPTTIELGVSSLLKSNGLLSIAALCNSLNVSERQLERLFSKHIGLSPKFYSRIIRLGHVFQLMQAKDNSWSDLVYQSGFYDQSHFIKNFKEFTGEDPSSYGFDQKNMANFHLRK